MEQYPHHRYLRYLLSRKMSEDAVRATCLSQGLFAPDDLSEMLSDMGNFPKEWRAEVTSRSVKFRRWLRAQGVMDLWVEDATTTAAKALLYKKEVRKSFEAMLLAHGDPAQARDELLGRFTERMVPPLEVLVRYQKLFWDVGAVPPDKLFAFLEQAQEAETYLPALEGDLVKVYGQLGLHQKVRGEVFLMNVLEAANQQALRMRRNPEMGGQQLAGMSTAIKMGMDAMRELEELRQLTSGNSTLRQEAAEFVARPVKAREIVAFDELDNDVLEADFAVGESNVRRLPERR